MPDSLENFLSSEEWVHRFDELLLPQGKKLSSPRFLRELRLEKTGDGYELTGRLSGHSPTISFWPENADGWDFDASCDCDHAYFCAHAAALFFRAQKPGTQTKLLREARAATIPTPSENISLSEECARPPQPPHLAQQQKKDKVAPHQDSHPEDSPKFTLHLAEEPATGRTTRLLLQALKTPDRDTWLVARPTVSYGRNIFPLQKNDGEAESWRDRLGHNPHEEATEKIPRNKPAEFRALELLTRLGLTNLASNPSYRFLLSLEKKANPDFDAATAWFPEPHQFTPAIYWPWFRATALPKLQAAGWTVHIDENFGHHIRTLDNSDLLTDLRPSPGGWFTLSVGIDHEGENLDLLPILTALLDSDTIDQLNDLADDDLFLVYLPKSGALRFPAGRLRKILHHLGALTDPTNGQMHPLDAAALTLEPELPFHAPPELTKLRQTLKQHGEKSAPVYQPPAGLQATLRDYQKAGAQWLHFLYENQLHGILADDMGLGKTLQTLAHILTLKESSPGKIKPILIIAPTSVVPNWAAEAKKFTPALRVLTLQGSQRRKLYPHIRHADLVISSYAILQRDGDKLALENFEIIALDEAQHIKNPAASVTQAACKLRATQRLCLSGTPVENNLGELWSLFNFLLPGFLGTLTKFRQHYQNPIEKEENEERSQELSQRLAPLILRRTKDEVATELPPKTILVHPVELSSKQKDLYETVRATMDKNVRQAIAARGLEQSQFAILDALLKLRQICCHPALLKDKTLQSLPSDEVDSPKISNSEIQNPESIPSAKLSYLLELLDTLFQEKRRVLLFSQFTSMLAIIEAELIKIKTPYLKLTGASKNRGDLVTRFQSENIPIFLISLKAGGTGLNLTAADTVIHYDPWWNPAAENQATDRAYRIGQDKPVFVHKLICAGSVEDRIHQLQQQKAKLADSLLAGASKAIPNADTLQQLLAPIS